MSEKINESKKSHGKKEKVEQQKKSIKSSKMSGEVSNKKAEKTGTKDDDWNDPTGNSHLGNKS